MKKLILTMIVMGLLLVVGQVFAKGGGGKGGFGDLGSGCVTFLSMDDPGTVSDDGGGRYCNGSAGQVSVPVHLRFDTKKFNKYHRVFKVQGECLDSPLGGEANAQCTMLEDGFDGARINVTVLDVIGDLNWTEMSPGEDLDARMGIKIDNSHFLYFDPANCPEAPWEPIHVRCDSDANGDELCDMWTISTDPAFPTGNDTFSAGASNACFKSGAYGSFYSVAKANFTMEVCVMEVSCD